jgi:YbgC/YbaW family acyl-CoA thioester hydrolase
MTVERQNFRMLQRMRVRWAEVDMQKIVFNAHYLMYFDTAMSDYWRALGLPYTTTLETLQGDLYVKKASVEYFSSARYDDVLDVGLRLARIGNTSVTFHGAIFCGDTLLVTSELVYVFADPTSQTPKPVPTTLREAFERFEAGGDMTHVQVGTWDTLGPLASTLRESVFVQEQGIRADIVWDAADATAVHAVSINALGVPVATGRMVDCGGGVVRIGRMAVVRPMRGSSLGRDVLMALIDKAKLDGFAEVMLHAQCSAEGFYSRNHFVPRGPVFEEAGIRHIEMFKRLKAE